MGCLCCCFRPPKAEEPSALIKNDGSPVQSPRRSYGAIPTDEPSPNKSLSSSPRKSPNELLYNSPPSSARVKSPEPARGKSPEPSTVTSPGPRTKSGDALDESGDPNAKPKKTLAEIASMAKTATTTFSSTSRAPQTSTSSSVVMNVKEEPIHPKPSGDEAAKNTGVNFETIPRDHRSPSFESDTCHSIGGTTDEEESEDTRILRSLTPTSPSLASSDAHLLPSSTGSSSHDVSKDSTGKKHSKAKDFMKKAGKNVKKAGKKMKGVEKMFSHDKKKKEVPIESRERSDTPASTNETSASGGQVKRVTSERMKSKYAREKLAAMEKKREEEASHKAAHGITDPRQAAMERGEKLSELEDKTEHMRDQAASFAHNVSMLKARNQHSS